MPNAKPRKGSSNAEEDSQATFTLRVTELLGDTEVVSKIKRALYPDDIMAEIKGLRAEITQLRNAVDEKDRIIYELHDRVSVLEASVEASEQYGRRANLRIQGIVESGAGGGRRAAGGGRRAAGGGRRAAGGGRRAAGGGRRAAGGGRRAAGGGRGRRRLRRSAGCHRRSAGCHEFPGSGQ